MSLTVIRSFRGKADKVFFYDLDKRFGPADQFPDLIGLLERLEMFQKFLQTSEVFARGLQAFIIPYTVLSHRTAETFVVRISQFVGLGIELPGSVGIWLSDE